MTRAPLHNLGKNGVFKFCDFGVRKGEFSVKDYCMIMSEHAWVGIGLFGSEKGEFFARFWIGVGDFCTQ